MEHLPYTGHCSRNLQVLFHCYYGSYPGDKCVCHFTVGRTHPEAVASNLKDTNWQHQDLNPDHLTPPEPLFPATLLLHACEWTQLILVSVF